MGARFGVAERESVKRRPWPEWPWYCFHDTEEVERYLLFTTSDYRTVPDRSG